VSEFPETDSANAVLPNKSSRTTAQPASIVRAHFELRFQLLLLNKRLLGQINLRKRVNHAEADSIAHLLTISILDLVA
jgi:hypothetical protein